MGKLKKMIAGLAAMLSLGSAVGNNNVFAISGKELKNDTELCNKNLLKYNYEDKSKPLARLSKIVVESYYRTLVMNGCAQDNAIARMQILGAVPQGKDPALIDAIKELKSGKWMALKNRLICDIHGTILTYGDLFPKSDSVKKNGLPKIPILVNESGEIIYFSEELGMIIYKLPEYPLQEKNGDLKFKDCFAKNIGDELPILVNKDGKGLKYDGKGGLVEVGEEKDALRIDPDTFGLKEYKEPEIVIEIKKVEPEVNPPKEKKVDPPKPIPVQTNNWSQTSSSKTISNSDYTSSNSGSGNKNESESHVGTYIVAAGGASLLIGGGVAAAKIMKKNKQIIDSRKEKIKNGDVKENKLALQKRGNKQNKNRAF